MPDAMDRVQQHAADLNDDALRRHRQQQAQRAGLSECERLDCREPIRPERTARGARLCDECQEEQDKRDVHFATWARRR
ncbi:MAG: hypothetical protein ACREO4_16180 [Lysobacter sp.]